MNKGELSICTLEMYVEGAYRYYALRHTREIPTPGEIFTILIDMWSSQNILSSSIWCQSAGVEINTMDICLEDVEFVLDHKRMAHITEYDYKQRYIAQQPLLGRY